ncbi:MAG: electron transfer flavoprotein subunit alpha/FixB family protein [Nitrososphaeria archaeon]
MKQISKILIISDDNKDRVSELNFVAKKFNDSVDAIIFTTQNMITIDACKVYGINDLPMNSIDAVFSIAKNYDLIMTNGFVGASIAGILSYNLRAHCIFGVTNIDFDNFKYAPTNFPLVVNLKEKYFEQLLSEKKVNVHWLNTEGKVQVVKEEKVEKEVELDKAKIVIGGGRGIGSKEGFDILGKLSKIIGGVVGASRAAVDNGWISHQYQIGQSGAMLSANLYFAFGISGATQHLSGIKNVKCVVAVNTDPEVPIFKRARYNIVADWKEFAFALIKELEAANG